MTSVVETIKDYISHGASLLRDTDMGNLLARCRQDSFYFYFICFASCLDLSNYYKGLFSLLKDMILFCIKDEMHNITIASEGEQVIEKQINEKVTIELSV